MEERENEEESMVFRVLLRVWPAYLSLQGHVQKCFILRAAGLTYISAGVSCERALQIITRNHTPSVLKFMGDTWVSQNHQCLYF